MKLRIITTVIIVFAHCSVLFSQGFDLFKPQIKSCAAGREHLLKGEYEKAVDAYSLILALAQQRRTTSQGVDGDLVGEYAFALALDGKRDLALVYADRARILGAQYKDFYSSAVLQIAGLGEEAAMFSYDEMPKWIADNYVKIVAGQTVPRHTIEVKPGDLQKAADLQRSGQDIQALVLLKALAAKYPDAQIVHLFYSNLCEKLGFAQHAARELAVVISLLKDDDENRDKYVKHHDELLKKALAEQSKKKPSFLSGSRLIVYAGASIAKDSYSLNTRVGLYTAKNFSASLNLGGSYGGDTFSGSVGLSGYYQWRCLVIGQGISCTFGGGSTTLNYSPSIGLSFMPRKSQNTSYDITIGANIPFMQDGAKTSIYFSVGRTFYFDLNKWK